MKRRQFAALAAPPRLAAPAVLRAGPHHARSWSAFRPGGSVDVIARLLAEKLRVSLGQNVIVDNKPGAAGRVALGELKRAAPDGQTLVLSPSGAMVIPPWLYTNLRLRPDQGLHPDFARHHLRLRGHRRPGRAGRRPQGGAGLDEGQSDARPTTRTSGAGTVPHFAGVLLAQAAGVPLTHVAYSGGAPAAQDLIGGQIPLMVDTASETLEHHKAGKVRILAVTGEQRIQGPARRADAEGSRHQHRPPTPSSASTARAGMAGRRGGPHRPRGGRCAAGARRPGEDLRLRPGAQPLERRGTRARPRRRT